MGPSGDFRDGCWPPACLQSLDPTPSKPSCAEGEAAPALIWAARTCQCPSNAEYFGKTEANGPCSPSGMGQSHSVTTAVLGRSLAGGEHHGKSSVREKNGSKTCETWGSADYGTEGPHQLHHSRFSLSPGSCSRESKAGICLAAAPGASPFQMPGFSHKALSSHEK